MLSDCAVPTLIVSDPCAAPDLSDTLTGNEFFPLTTSTDDAAIDELVLHVARRFVGGVTPLGQAKFNLLQSIGDFIGKSRNTDIVKRGTDAIVKFRDEIPEAFRGQTDPFINGILLKGLVTKKKEAGLLEQSEYIKSKLPEEDKKGF